MRFPLVLLAAILFLAPTAQAQKKKQKSIAPPATVIRMPVVRMDTLANGLRVIHCKVNDVPLAEVNVMIDAGVRREAVGEEGLAQFTNRLLFAGTATRTRADIIANLSTLGAALSSFTNKEYAQVYLRSLTKNLPRSLEILADVCINPIFPELEFKNESERLRRAQASQSPNPGELATLTLFRGLFGEAHPLARPLIGGMTALGQLTKSDVAQFHRNTYRPERTTIVIVGNIDSQTAFTLARDRFGSWRSDPETTPTPVPEIQTTSENPEIRVHDEVDATYAQIRYGFRLPGRKHPLFVPFLLMNQILGGSSESRLFRKLWVEHPVMPSFYSTLGLYVNDGYCILSGSAPAVRIDSVMFWIDESIRDMILRPPTENELERAKRELLRDREYLFSTNKKMQEQLIDAVIFGVTPAEIGDFGDAVQSVSAAKIQEAARAVFEDKRRVVSIVGNAQAFLPALQLRYRGQVTVEAIPSAKGDME